ncbi:MAG: YceI family protein [Balneolaceae bacterium]
MKILLSILLLLTFGIQELSAQIEESLNISGASSIEIDGTSTLHDWTVEATEFTVEFKVPRSWTKGVDFWIPEEVESLIVRVPVEKLESGKGGMDRRMYRALKKDEYPDIVFIYENMEIVDTGEENVRVLNINGELTTAGKTLPVVLNVRGKILSTNALKFSGQYEMKMTDFDVDPPSAMLGTIKSGDEITIRFDIIFQ